MIKLIKEVEKEPSKTRDLLMFGAGVAVGVGIKLLLDSDKIEEIGVNTTAKAIEIRRNTKENLCTIKDKVAKHHNHPCCHDEDSEDVESEENIEITEDDVE
ncbi:MAG: hypothetical protein Q4Q23_07815 [Methanobacteriaceae archaeon]|nr:hypothetical protein [Methanobacteriaceae archaeon]